MSSNYTSTTAALKAVIVDSRIIKSNKILIKKKTDNGDYVDILNEVDTINGRLEEIDSTIFTAALTDKENVFSSANTFEAPIQTNDIIVDGGSLTFTDTIDGTVVDIKNPNASGYRYIPGIPGSFDNGACYDIGEISDLTDLSLVRFSAEGRLVQTCELWFRTSATPSTKHKWPTGIYWIDSATGAAPTLIGSKNYRLVFRQEPNKIIASIAYLY